MIPNYFEEIFKILMYLAILFSKQKSMNKGDEEKTLKINSSKPIRNKNE